MFIQKPPRQKIILLTLRKTQYRSNDGSFTMFERAYHEGNAFAILVCC